MRSLQYAKMSVINRIDWPRRIDVGAAGDVLLQQVVLDRAAADVAQRRRPALPPRARRASSRIAAVELIVIDVVTFSSGRPAKQQSHVLDRVDRDTDLADLALGARVVGVVAHLCGQVERARQPGLAGVRAGSGSARSSTRRSRTRRTAASSRAVRGASSDRCRGCTAVHPVPRAASSDPSQRGPPLYTSGGSRCPSPCVARPSAMPSGYGRAEPDALSR